ncbi:MAG: cupin [Eubacterium sp.]|jgi:quercetin dioxygenase-like cupin family protein|uniref:cupin domain-containing protein n=1 Tax=Eubacterium sp. F2 TaxID=3381348 RepID=UPI0039084445|nr:cupin [Eubacterium sp.]MCI2198090.1 cupin [Eubacterium sp.]
MKEEAGRIFKIAEENAPVPGCTISNTVGKSGSCSITHFALAEGTDISAEIYRNPKLWIAAGGKMTAFGRNGFEKTLGTGDVFVVPADVPIGIRAEKDSVYTEITLQEESEMNKVLKSAEVFSLKDLIPYQDGKIVNMDLINDPKLKLVIMSFDAGTGLEEHAAPGEALITALDGEAVIGYEGKEYRIKAGENFKFDKLGRHSVTADHKFKMALLLQLD